MTHVRRRQTSPSSGRIVDPMRASTGNLPVGSTIDPYHSSASRGHDGHSSPRAGRDRMADMQQPSRYWDSSGRRSGSSRLEAQPISTKTYRDAGNSTKSTTEYAIRPRSHTDTGRRPLSVIVPPATNRQSPIVESDYERARSPLPKSYHGSEDADPHIYPATSSRGRYHHRGHGTEESDSGRLAPNDKESRARMDRGKYRNSGSGASKGYPVSGSLVKHRGGDFDDLDAYSYTNPEEQFDRDSVAGQQQFRRANYGRKERPRSMTGLDGYRPQLELRREPRESGPPTSRAMDRLRPEDGYRSSGGRSPRPSHRTPVSLHKVGDDGYSSYQEGYGDSRDPRRSRHHEDGGLRGSRHRPHGSRDDHHYGVDTGHKHTGDYKSGAEAAVGYPTDPRSRDHDYDGRRMAREHDAEHARDHGDGKHGAREPKSGDESGRIRSLRKEAARKDHFDSDADDYSTDEDSRRYLRPPARRPDPGSPSEKHRHRDDSHPHWPRGSDIDDSDSRRPARRSHRKDSDEEELSDSRRGMLDDRVRKSHTSDRALSREPDTPPKSILKAPREKFPEDKNAVREGVAPLKDATKKGIPPGARWTKIDRKMVNPAALEAKQERFEERLDYVIVLRVLTREEIQEFADETQKIREERYEAERQERRRRHGDDHGHRRDRDRHDYHDGSDADTSDDDDDEAEVEDAKSALALEPPPSRRQPQETRS